MGGRTGYAELSGEEGRGRPHDVVAPLRSLEPGAAVQVVVASRRRADELLDGVAAEAGGTDSGAVRITAAGEDGPFGLARRLGAVLIGERDPGDPVFVGAGGFAWDLVGAGAVPPEEVETVIYGLSWLFLGLLEEAGETVLLVGQADRADPESRQVLEVMAGRARDFGLGLVVAGVADDGGRVRRWSRFQLIPTVPVSPPEQPAPARIPDPAETTARLEQLAPDDPAAVRLVVEAGHLLIEGGRPDEAAELAEGAIAAATRRGVTPDPGLLVTAARASQLVIARRERAVELTRIIAASGPAAGTPGSRYLGEIALERVNTVAAGREAVVEAGLAAVAPGREDPTRLDANLGWFFGCFALHLAERNRDALAVLDLAVAEAGRRRSLPDFVRAIALRSGPLFHLGHLREAAVDCELALSAGFGDLEIWLPAVRSTLIQLRTFMLDFEGAGRVSDRHRSPADETATAMMFRFGRGTMNRLAGRGREALDDFVEAGRLMAAGLGDNPAIMPWRAAAAATLVGSGEPGDRERALAFAEEELDLARSFGSPGPLGTALWSRGLCEEDGGRRLELLREAVASHRQGERMVERIEAELDLIRALVATGEEEEAREIGRETLHLAHVAGADLMAGRVREVLVAAGGKPRRPVVSGPESLTPSERRIVGLAAAGFSNRELAESLFLTMKTVEWHLTRAYAKLGISGRSDLAVALEPAPRGFRGAGGVDSLVGA